MSRINLLAVILSFALAGTAVAEEASFQTKTLTPETALKAAQAALDACRDAGYQVAVTVVDRAGLAQVVLRDRFAGAHTIPVSADKAWTAASFRTSTMALAEETQAGKSMSGLRNLPHFLAAGGGLTIEAAGTSFGAIGVSGAPGGEADEDCAKAGIQAIRDDIEF